MAKGSEAAFVITLIGAIFGLIGGIIKLTGGTFLFFPLHIFGIFLIFWGIWFLIANSIILYFSFRMKTRECKNAGIICLILGILSFNILVIIGSIIAIAQSK